MFGCDGCDQCDVGRYNLCVQGPTALGAFTDGGMSEYFTAPRDRSFRSRPGSTSADACLIEPAVRRVARVPPRRTSAPSSGWRSSAAERSVC